MSEQPMSYEEMVASRQAYYESERADDRVALAGFFYERGEPLTDEVLATREYLRRKALGLMDMSASTTSEEQRR